MDTHERLRKYGTTPDTFDRIVRRLLDHVEGFDKKDNNYHNKKLVSEIPAHSPSYGKSFTNTANSHQEVNGGITTDG
jgi:hypothetical protein